MDGPRFLSVKEFAKCVGIGERKARQAMRACHEGKKWRGCRLAVHLVSASGGPRGLTYRVDAASIPPRFLVAAERPISVLSEPPESATGDSPALHAIAIPPTSPVAAPGAGQPPARLKHDDQEAAWREALIKPIAQGTTAGSAERAKQIAALASSPVKDWKGAPRTLTEHTLREWTFLFEVSGPPGLMGKVQPPPPPTLARSAVTGDHREAQWRLSIIQPIRHETAPRSAARAARVTAVASVPIQHWSGQACTICEATIRGWIARYEARGMLGLMRKAPHNAGKSRVHLSRAWDRVMLRVGASEAQLTEIVGKVKQRVRSEWRSGTPSWPTVQLNTLPLVVELTRAAGVDKPNLELRTLCQVPRRFIEDERRYAIVAMMEQDAARFASQVTPRIKRDRSHLLPGDWIAADVHHLDVLFRRPDGTDCTPKAVAWYDLATNRTRFDIFVMPKGEMIRREHVIQSFVALCTDPNWGVPSQLYTDNGGEYNWMELAEDMGKLKRSIDVHCGENPDGDEKTIHRARPYNPQAKVIEGLFSTLERVAFAQLPGYIGGNRMRKKTANQGREPQPYPGDEAQLRKAIDGALAYYHLKPQSGHLNGKSPDARFAEFVAVGWHSTILDPWELSVVFSRELVKPVRTGGTIRLDSKDFRADALLSHVGRRVLVRQPLFGDRDALFIFTEHGEPIAMARPDNVYVFGDPRGAGEQSRREKALKTGLKALATEAPRTDAEAVLAHVVALHGDPAQAPTDGVIRLNPEFSEAARMAKEAPQRAEEQADRTLSYRAEKSALLARLRAASA